MTPFLLDGVKCHQLSEFACIHKKVSSYVETIDECCIVAQIDEKINGCRQWLQKHYVAAD